MNVTDVYHVGLPIACAGLIAVGNHIYIDDHKFVVIKVGGVALDMTALQCSRYAAEGYGRTVTDCPTRCQSNCLDLGSRCSDNTPGREVAS